MPKLIIGLYDDVDDMALATSPQSFIRWVYIIIIILIIRTLFFMFS